MTELKNVKLCVTISLSLCKGEIRESSKDSANNELIQTLLFEPMAEKTEGLICKINLNIIILSKSYIQKEVLNYNIKYNSCIAEMLNNNTAGWPRQEAKKRRVLAALFTLFSY